MTTLKHGDLICNTKDDSGLWLVVVTSEGTKIVCLVNAAGTIQNSSTISNMLNPDSPLNKFICNLSELYLSVKDKV